MMMMMLMIIIIILYGHCALNSGQDELSYTTTLSISVSTKHWCIEAHRNTAVFGEQPDSLPQILSRRAWDRIWAPAVSGHRLTDPWHTPCSMEFGRQLLCDSFSLAETDKLSIEVLTEDRERLIAIGVTLKLFITYCPSSCLLELTL